MIVWRIAVESPTYAASDLSGEGAKRTGGRWNRRGLALVYCSQSIALAVLETLAHLNQWDLPLNRFLVEVSIPDPLWQSRQIVGRESAPGGWDAIPAGMASVSFGDIWLASASSAVLEVPSVIVPEECNVLLNPLHPDASRIQVRTIRRWSYDHRI